MTPQARTLAILAASPALLPLAHGLAVRLLRAAGARVPPQGLCVLVGLAGAPAVLAACWRFSWASEPASWLPWSLAYAAVVYLSFAYAYFHLFNMTETARRIRILAEFRRKGPMKAEELALAYAPGHMLEVRLGRLLDLGQLRREGERYRVANPLLLTCARLVAAYGRLLDSSWAPPARAACDGKDCPNH